MSATHSTERTRSKPAKPYPEFPLFPRATGRWAKKIRGKLHYFGVWADPDGALAKYLDQKDDLYAGRKPREVSEGVTVCELCNAFLNQKQAMVEASELSPRTWSDYKLACEAIVIGFGKQRVLDDLQPDDFASLRKKLARKNGLQRLGQLIQCIRCVFKFGYEPRIIPTPMIYGPGFKRPSKKTLRLHRAQQGAKLFTAQEIHKILDAASVPMRAMILLGINAGFGNSDVGNLPQSALDLERGCVDYSRPTTGIPAVVLCGRRPLQRSRKHWRTIPSRRTKRMPTLCSSRYADSAGLRTLRTALSQRK